MKQLSNFFYSLYEDYKSVLKTTFFMGSSILFLTLAVSYMVYHWGPLSVDPTDRLVGKYILRYSPIVLITFLFIYCGLFFRWISKCIKKRWDESTPTPTSQHTSTTVSVYTPGMDWNNDPVDGIPSNSTGNNNPYENIVPYQGITYYRGIDVYGSERVTNTFTDKIKQTKEMLDKMGGTAPESSASPKAEPLTRYSLLKE